VADIRVGKDEAEGIPAQPRKDVEQPPGEAARLGIEERCRGGDLALEPVLGAAPGSAHRTACHAVPTAAAVAERGAPA